MWIWYGPSLSARSTRIVWFYVLGIDLGKNACSLGRELARALKQIYKAKDADAGKLALDDFAEGAWARNIQPSRCWRRNWSKVIPFFAFPDDVRRIIYTTDSIESLTAKLRRAVKTRGHFPTDESALKLLSWC